MASWRYRPALDGLRCLAVYLVLLFHAGMVTFKGGFIGVDLFFVLSGFLVSNIILTEVDETGRLHLGRFYARRVRRLLPAAVVTVAATSTAFMLVASTASRIPFVRDAQSALLYFANWRFLLQSNDYFAENVAKSPFLHFWSLSLEEQFYLVFPLLLVGLVWLGRRRRSAVPVGLGIVCGLSLVWQVYISGTDANHAYYGTAARLYQLMAGALLAVYLRRRGRRTQQDAPGSSTVATVTGVLGLVATVVLASRLVDLDPSTRGIVATVTSVALIYGVMTAEGAWLSRLLALPVPVYLGRISYGTYLWHWPVIVVALMVLDSRPLVVAGVAAAVATGLAALSFQVLELPIRQGRPLRRFRWSTVVVGVVVSATAAAVLVPTTLGSKRKPDLVASTSTESQLPAKSGEHQKRDRPVPSDIDWKKVKKDIGPPDTFCTPHHLHRCIVTRGRGPTVVLVGDSHARMMAPMFTKLAKKHDFTLALNVVKACTWETGIVNTSWPKKLQHRCTTARKDWYTKVLPKLEPDLVILATAPRDSKSLKGVLVPYDGSPTPILDLHRHAIQTTLRQIKKSGARTLILDSTLEAGNLDPVDCLSGAKKISQCQVPVPLEKPAIDSLYKVADMRSRSVYTANINPAICPGAPVCDTVVDGHVVWRNRSHLTTRFLVDIKDDAWKLIEKSGALRGLR